MVGAATLGQATVTTDRSQINILENKLAAEGNADEGLVAHFDAVAAHLAFLQREIGGDDSKLKTDHKTVAVATTHVRQWAIDAYVAATSGESPTATFFGTGANANHVAEAQTYLGVTSGTLDDAVSALQQDENHTNATELTLEKERAETQQTLRDLASSRRAAEAGIARDDELLNSVKGNLLALVTAAAQRREQARVLASERALAQQAQQTTFNGVLPTSHVSSGSYANPLRDLRGLSAERIDQGVDFSGYGPVYAVGDGVVISTGNGGWPGGTFISYRLSDGPAAGLVVYAAEDVNPSVQVGQQVDANTVLGQLYEGATGMEMGWSDASGDGTTMASDNRQYYGGNSTAFGANFSALVQSLGGPGGQMQSSPPTGSLPSNWPSW